MFTQKGSQTNQQLKLVSICSATGWHAVISNERKQLLCWGLTDNGELVGMVLDRAGSAISAEGIQGFEGYRPYENRPEIEKGQTIMGDLRTKQF